MRALCDVVWGPGWLSRPLSGPSLAGPMGEDMKEAESSSLLLLAPNHPLYMASGFLRKSEYRSHPV